MPPDMTRKATLRSPARRWALLSALVLTVLLTVLGMLFFLPLTLEAQSTGGSFGGGDWGGGGGGGGGGSYGGGGGSSDHDESAFFLFELVILAFRINPIFGLVVLVIGVAVLIARASSRGGGSGGGVVHRSWGQSTGGYQPPILPILPSVTAPSSQSRAWMGADVTQVRIALDVSARPAIEEALQSLMRSVDVRSRHGLLLVVHRVAAVLRANERAWRLGGESNYHPMSPPQASGVFQQLAASGRARAGQAVSSSPDPTGVFFVTLLVAAKREIVDFHAHRPEQLRMILDDLGRMTEQDLVAAEVYWLPLASGMGMSADEVRRLHPDMKPVEHAHGSPAVSASAPVVAAPFCPHCGRQQLQRLTYCEHCGAPR